jgi:hypothetical protein
VDALPQWTTKIDKRGLDPLGMQNAGVGLYQDLLPGISNITLRMRYYGFFCWLSDAYARRGVTTDFELWRKWVRRAEALFALVCADANGQSGVGGIDWASDALESGDDFIDFEAAASTRRRACSTSGSKICPTLPIRCAKSPGPNKIKSNPGTAAIASTCSTASGDSICKMMNFS